VTLSKLAQSYIEKTEQVIRLIMQRGNLKERKTEEVLDQARRYLKDAIYFMNEKKFETALASVAYSEGLLDALRLLGLVEFQWPSERV
jgi:FAD synthetase